MSKRHVARCAIALALALLSAPRAHAQTGSSELGAPQQAALDATTKAALGQIDRATVAPFTLNAKVEAGVGQGSFVADPYARNPYFAWGASFVPAYYPLPALTLSVFAKLSQEVTDSDIDSKARQVLFYDMQLRARYVTQIPVINVDVVTEGRLYLPTSKVSQYETLVLGALGRVALFRSFGPVVIGYSGSFRKNFHRYESPLLQNGDDGCPSDAQEPGEPGACLAGIPSGYIRGYRPEDPRGPSQAPIGANNISFSFSNSFFVSYVPISRLSLSLYYGISQAFTYERYPRDELSSPYADEGRGRRDTGAGGFELWFRLDKRFSFSAGVYTGASPKAEDNRSFRFPFYDFSSTASNLTTFYLDVTMTEFLGG